MIKRIPIRRVVENPPSVLLTVWLAFSLIFAVVLEFVFGVAAYPYYGSSKAHLGWK